MTTYADGYDEVDSFESFDFESSDEATRPFRPGGRVFAPGGLSSATLHTPKGPAKLNLPSPVPTLAQFRTLEQALNANTQRVNAVQTELARVRRELALRRQDPQSMNTMSMFLMMKLRQDFKGHRHDPATGGVTLSSDSGGFSSFLPLMMLQPGLFGQSGSGTASSGSQDAMSPLMLMALLEFLEP